MLDRVRVYAHKLLEEWHVPRDRGKWDDWQAAPAFAEAFDTLPHTHRRRAPATVR